MKLDPSTLQRRAATLSSILQIIALLTAGGWAFYTFVYEEQIKPAAEPINVTSDLSLEQMGEKNGFVAVRARILMRNNGKTAATVLGYTLNAAGIRLQLSAQPLPKTDDDTGSFLRYRSKYWREAGRELTTSIGMLTKEADAKAENHFGLPPGAEYFVDHTLYIDSRRFDALGVQLNFYYIKGEEKQVPLTLSRNKEGYVSIRRPTSCSGPNDCVYSNDFSVLLSLWPNR